MIFKKKKKNEIFGSYLCCNHINNAIRFILEGKTDLAIDSLFHAILEGHGHFYQDLYSEVMKIHNKVEKERRQELYERWRNE